MSRIPPIVYEWTDDGHMVPLPFFRKRCDEIFVVGEHYRLDSRVERSVNSHRHYFAAIAEVHRNLPDELAERWPTPEHIRKYELIRCGYRDERSMVCSSKAEALRVMLFIRENDDFGYDIITIHERTVIHYKAKSQSVAAQGAKEFQESKTKVLDFLASLIGTDARTLAANTDRAA